MAKRGDNEGKRQDLAVAVAAGTSIKKWAEGNGVPVRTAYEWSYQPEFKLLVARHRRKLLDAALGQLVTLAEAAVVQLGALAQESMAEGIRLNACKAILEQVVAIQNHATLQERVDALQEEVESLKAKGDLRVIDIESA